MSGLEQIHELFRGSAELSKIARAAALALDFAAAAIALIILFGPDRAVEKWQPFVGLLLLIGSQLLVGYADSSYRFAERCRRLSARAFGVGKEPQPSEVAKLESAAPAIARWIAARLPARGLQAYYAPQAPPGPSRLREIYAHSAYYTWRVLEWYARIQSSLAAFLLLGTFAFMYWLIVEAPPRETSLRILEALSSIILAVLGLQAFRAGQSAGASAREAKAVLDGLTTSPAPSGDRLDAILDHYDFSRTGRVPVPTLWYKFLRRRLAREWPTWRQALS